MDDQAVIRTYGNTKLPEGTPDRPLVTFAVFAYNQENYIREAVESAFSQTYFPLEIILSDDCSSDQTFAIMNDLARSYDGPHTVKIVRHSQNLGVLNHVLRVAKISGGVVVIVAAGDDVSLRHRVDRIAELMTTTDVVAICSGAETYETTSSYESKRINLSQDAEFRNWFGSQCVRYINGATAAYRRDFLLKVEQSSEKVHLEDLIFSTLAAANKQSVAFIDESLVKYRANDGALTNNCAAAVSVRELRFRTRRHAELRLTACRHIDSVLEKYGNPEHIDLLRSIRRTEAKDRFRTKIYSDNFSDRIPALFLLRRGVEFRDLAKGIFGAQAHDFILKIKKVLKSA